VTAPPTDLAELARRFDADRPRLRSVALHLLGSVPDADDAVQSAWLMASRSDFGAVENLTGWFTTITANAAFDQLRVRKRRAERPLAEPDELDRITVSVSAPAEDDSLLADSAGRALLVVLDRLSPAQRVAFVLHDRSPAAAKKLASRARGRLDPDRATRSPHTAAHVKIVEALLAASRGGDIGALLDLLAPDVVRRVDRDLVPDGVPTEVRGARAVAEETRLFTQRAQAGAVLLIDGVPGVAIAPAGRLWALLRIGIGDDNRIHTIDITGPSTSKADGLRRTALALSSWPSQQDHRTIGYEGPHVQPAAGPERAGNRPSGEHHVR
jgi:DNA-directed RNA polymerase specialized sigma24 family protein